MQVSELHVLHGVCYALLVYDVGLSIDLEACTQRLTTTSQRVRISPKHRTPQYFEYRPAPLHITQEAPVLTFGTYCSSTSVDVPRRFRRRGSGLPEPAAGTVSRAPGVE